MLDSLVAGLQQNPLKAFKALVELIPGRFVHVQIHAPGGRDDRPWAGGPLPVIGRELEMSDLRVAVAFLDRP